MCVKVCWVCLPPIAAIRCLSCKFRRHASTRKTIKNIWGNFVRIHHYANAHRDLAHEARTHSGAPNSAADLWVLFEVFTAAFDIHFMEHYWTFKCTTYIGYQGTWHGGTWHGGAGDQAVFCIVSRSHRRRSREQPYSAQHAALQQRMWAISGGKCASLAVRKERKREYRFGGTNTHSMHEHLNKNDCSSHEHTCSRSLIR